MALRRSSPRHLVVLFPRRSLLSTLETNPSGGVVSLSRKVFLTQMIDPSGNAVSLSDVNFRVVKITDAIGQFTSISYGHPTDPFKITKVTDPSGRSATFDYDTSGRLITITDVIGPSSEFTYDAGDFITALKTPYGVTSFVKGESPATTTRSLENNISRGTIETASNFNQSTTLGVAALDPVQKRPGWYEHGKRLRPLPFRNTFYWAR